MNIVLLSGPARAGKSTVAEIFQDYYPCYIHRFAAPLKNFCTQILGLDREYVYGDKKEEPLPEFGGKSARQIQQTLGTEWGRHMIHPDIWARTAYNRLVSLDRAGDWVHVFDDTRFQNEIDVMKRDPGNVVYSIRIVPNHSNYVAIQDSGHASEQQELQTDLVWYNNDEQQNLHEYIPRLFPDRIAKETW